MQIRATTGWMTLRGDYIYGMFTILIHSCLSYTSTGTFQKNVSTLWRLLLSKWISYVWCSDLESMWVFFRPWKTASSGWRITVLNSWTAGLPNRLRKEKAVSPQWASWRYQHLPVLASPSTAPTQMCSRSSRSHGPVLLEGIWERDEGWEKMNIKARLPPCALMSSEFMPRAGLPLWNMSNCWWS